MAITLGLASRRFRGALPPVLGKYPGDALWASMIYFGLGFLYPNASKTKLALLTFGLCVVVELLKLYQAPWIVGIRHTMLGHLVFGHIFSWANLVAYAVGTGVAVMVDVLMSVAARSRAVNR